LPGRGKTDPQCLGPDGQFRGKTRDTNLVRGEGGRERKQKISPAFQLRSMNWGVLAPDGKRGEENMKNEKVRMKEETAVL